MERLRNQKGKIKNHPPPWSNWRRVVEWKTITLAKTFDGRGRFIIGKCTDVERGDYPRFSELGWMEVNFCTISGSWVGLVTTH